MDEISMLEKRQDEFDNRLRHTEIALERNNVLTEKNTAVLEKFDVTLDAMKDAMLEISATTTENGRVVAELTENVSALTTKINDVDGKVDGVRSDMETRIRESDARNQIDIRDVCKRILTDCLIGGGFFGILYYLMLNGIVK